MKYDVDCPRCGSFDLKVNPTETASHTVCQNCGSPFSEYAMLRHMRDKDGMNRSAPAFRVLDALKPKGRSDAARAVFG